MFVPAGRLKSGSRGLRHHSVLLASVSVAALLIAGSAAGARSLRDRGVNAQAAAAAAAQTNAQAAAMAASQAITKVNASLQMLRSQQAAARAAAQAAASTVPDGLTLGGLVVAPGAEPRATDGGAGLWQGAGLPTQTTSAGRIQVKVTQNQQKAILTWSSFNVGRETDLYFNQTAGGGDASNWIALNRVLDPTIAPSRILGTIKAEGQVYVINKNGIVFGGSSQVNVGSLVASSLSLSNTQFLAGINKRLNEDIHFLPQFGEYPTSVSLTAGGRQPAPYIPGDVTVEAGARITSARQGLVALFGLNVANRGAIETPGGQTLLAAGEIVQLNPHAPGMIGMRAYVSARPEFRDQPYTAPRPNEPNEAEAFYARNDVIGMNVINDGLVIAAEGNIGMAGRKVVQNGLLSATTTLNAAGSIELFAHDGYFWHPTGGFARGRGGDLILGPDSISMVQVDRDATAGTGGTAGDASFVNLWGKRIWLQENARVQSEGGKATITATSQFETEFFASSGLGFTSQPSAGARVLMAAGAVIDVAGVRDASVPVDRNSVEVEVRANEVRDSPLQRDGILKGKKIWVDRRVSGKREDGSTWKGTQLVDANEYISNVPTSMAERAVKGGTVSIRAGEMVMTPGAEISVAGGSIRYLDGYVKTTQLVGADGRRYNIGSAPADMIYAGIAGGFVVSHSHWKDAGAVAEIFAKPLSRGATAGRFEKGYVQGADAGALEIYAPVQILDGLISAQALTGERQVAAPPKGGTLVIGSISPPDGNYNVNNLVIRPAVDALPNDLTMTRALPASRVSDLVLTNDLFNASGLSEVTINVKTNVTLAADTDIALQPGGKLAIGSGLGASSFVIDGSIRVPNGNVGFSDQGGIIRVKAGAKVDVSGQWTNLALAPATAARVRDAGAISLVTDGATGRLIFETGAMLAANAGATLDAKGKVTAGSTGSISLGAEIAFPIDLNAVSMSAYGLAASDQVAVAPAGGALTLNLPALSIAASGAASGANVVGADFFDRGGFGKFTFKLAGGIPDGLTFAPRTRTRVLTADFASRTSADTVAPMAVATALPEERQRGVDLAVSVAGDFVLGADSAITTAIGGKVSINATGPATVAGRIEVPAGAIAVGGSTTTLAPTAQLLARGATRIVADGNGLRSGEVLDGGSISLSGNINVSAGALIDVSGTIGTIDVVKPGARAGQRYAPLTLASGGGTISLGGRGFVAGTLLANAGGAGAAGGTLTLEASGDAPAFTIPTTVYFQDANGVWQSRTVAQDLDINNQFSGAAITFNSAFTGNTTNTGQRTRLTNAARNGSGGGLSIINNDSLVPGAAGWENFVVSLQDVDPEINQSTLNIVSLYNAHFYNRTGTSPNFVYTKLNFNPAITDLVVRQSAFQNGGFSNIDLKSTRVGVRLGEGVDISANSRIAVFAPVVTNFRGASAGLAAPLVTFDTGRAATSAASRAGIFSVHAQQIEVTRAAFKGFASVAMRSAGDVILSGGSTTSPASLYVDGALNLEAGQVYPTTQGTAKITATQTITVDQSRTRPVAPLSAAGNLTLAAPTIIQNGTLRAPFGQITLDATTSLTLGSGSLTSVSGTGVIVPFGRIVDEVFWYTDQNPNAPIVSPPEKRLTLKAPSVNTQAGSVIDLSGGGDLLAYQHIPGSGGSSDYLDTTTYPGAAAILPIGMVSDHVGKRIIHFDGGTAIPAGDYVVMPASYALLPGAFRLDILNGRNGLTMYDLAGGGRLADGATAVSGRGAIGGTDIRDPRRLAYRVSPIDTVRLHSEYKVWTANAYFTSNDFVEATRRQSGIEVTAIPRLPRDAGALQIEATLAATLNATLLGSAEQGARGVLLDISAGKIAIASGADAASYRAAGYLVLGGAELSAFGGESLLLGGTRRQTVSGLEVDATATSVVVKTGANPANALVAPEILLASEDRIDILDGSRIEARGSVGSGSGNVIIKPIVAAVTDTNGTVTTPARDFGAFVRISNGQSVRVVRDGVQATQGTLAVGSATLLARTLLFDATKTTTVSGGAALLGQVLDVTSGRISIGTPAGTPDGLILSGASLAALLGATELRLRSYSSIDFHGDVGLGTRDANGAFTLGTLLLDAAALNSNAASSVAIAAGEVILVNTLGGVGSGLGGAGGTLAIAADTLALSTGAKKVDGFGSIRIAAAKAIIAEGVGAIDFGAAHLNLAAPRLTAESGASQDWTTTGTFTLTGTSSSAGDALGARLTITAASIVQGGLIDLTAGSLTLRARTGDITLTDGSVTRAQGFTRTFYDQHVDIAGGTVALIADNGAVQAQAGSLIDVSAAGSGEGGTVSIATPKRAAQLDGALHAGRGGTFALDTLTVGAFGTLSAKLLGSGFDGALSFRLRSGDVTLDGAASARRFELSTDAGSITVTGSVDASGVEGGTIRLSAKNDLTIVGGAVLRANAGDAAKRSGLIELAAADGNMDLRAGATIEARGGRNRNGEIRLRFKRDTSTVKLVNASATMTAAKIVAEAYRAYQATSVGAALPAALTDAAAFMSTFAAAIETSLGRAADPAFHLVPGIELDSAGDLTLAAATTLGGARYNGEAGVLTLRATGNLLLNASLSDGFASAAANAALLTDAASWSYRLVGGADLNAANPLALQPIGAFAGGASGNVRLASGAIVRTGTGSITIAAGTDVALADQKAVIYTAGARVADPTLGGTYDGTLDYSAPNPTPNDPNAKPPVVMPVFTAGGGDVAVIAQNDVKTSVASSQMIVDWLWRDGAMNIDGSFVANRHTAWWVNFARFEQGIAALGGGNVSVAAGRDVVNVSVSTPTQGRVGGGRTAAEARTVAITGGGDLSVAAGRDLIGGVYYVDKGTGTVSAGGSITSNRIASYDPDGSGPQVGRNVPIRTMLALGDAALTVSAGGTIDLGSASNPTMWAQADYQFTFRPSFPQNSTFSTYGANTKLDVTSVGGDISLWNQSSYLPAGAPAWASYRAGGTQQNVMTMLTSVYYPGRIKMIAASGDITIRGGMTLFPSATGNIDLWANDAVTLVTPLKTLDGVSLRSLVMSGVNPERLGTIQRPLASLFSGGTSLEGMGLNGLAAASTFKDGGLLHADDYEPSRIYANTGDINAATGQIFYQYFAEQVWFRAGRDINNLQVATQNNHASDLTLFQAGRDINLALGRISIDGPGFVLAEAGRDVFLGKGGGIQTLGNGEKPSGSGSEPPIYRNPYLPRKGADLTVLAGTADGPRYGDFIAAYLDPANVAAMASYLVTNGKPIYLDALVAFMRVITRDATLSEAAAFAAFLDPRYADYRKILIEPVLSGELRAAGRGQLDGLGDKGQGYERGYAALAKLFPGAEQRGNAGWQGDVVMDVSKIRTYLGGDIDIVAPGGKLQVSALSSQATGAEDGVLTINGGEIRITTGIGTIINKSRVLTARGGDITIWSTFGDIDAGKGRKSSQTNSARTYKLSADGSILYEVNPNFSGSGVRTERGTLDTKDSDVDLYAPNGIINASDAGIRSTGNIYLGALEIRGADNIQSGGEIKGLPKPASSGAPLTIETKDKAAADIVKDATQPAAGERPSVIIVEVLGYGGGDGREPPQGEDDERRRGTDGRQSYNADSPVQILGHGRLTDIQLQALTPEERARKIAIQ